MGNLGWVDFSATDRNRVATILDLLRPEGMVDELGLGTLRDALANQLFPGISTIQTRAKYYFLIPYILREYQTNASLRKKSTVSQYLESEEYSLQWTLSEKYNYERGIGIIGVTKRRPKRVLRRPSAIYWNGLNFFKFIDARGESLQSFLDKGKKSSMNELLRQTVDGDDHGDDADAGFENPFRIRVPYRQNWKTTLRLDLEQEEADFFSDRIQQFAPSSLLARLLTDDKLWSLADPVTKQEQSFHKFVEECDVNPIPKALSSTLILAHDFSELMYGAHLVYNCLVQSASFGGNAFESEWEEWKSQLSSLMLDYAGFNPESVLCLSSTAKPTTKQFVMNWWAEAKKGFPSIARRDRLVTEQERIVKGRKARLLGKQTEDVIQDVWIGLDVFDYRFSQGRRIAADIRVGMEGGDA